MNSEKKKVVVGLSGGVDSSAAAWLLKQQGYDVIGVFMRNWHNESVLISKECPWLEDSADAMMVAEALGIPFYTLDFSEEYRKRIVDYMFAEYEAGRTPNPDVLCNREIKFDTFLKAAEALGADFVATGHYCQKEVIEQNGQIIYQLIAGDDANKDQSYFLCQLNQHQLSKALFPIGHLKKTQVREIARSLNLVTADKKDSQGLCFIGKVRLPEFLQQQLQPRAGKVVLIPNDFCTIDFSPKAEIPNWDQADETALNAISSAPKLTIESGKIIGEHNGAHFYTIGQRKGLKIGGMKEPLFVIATDTKQNILYTGMGENHPCLYRYGLFVAAGDVHWIRTDMRLQAGCSMRVKARIRYRQPLADANLIMRTNGAYLIFDQPQKAITPGQFAAWYHGSQCLGSGTIS